MINVSFASAVISALAPCGSGSNQTSNTADVVTGDTAVSLLFRYLNFSD